MSPARTVVVVRRPASSSRSRPAARRRPAKRRSKRPTLKLAQWWPAVLVALVVLVGLAWDADGDDVPMATAECTLPASGAHLTGEQIANARTIAQVAWDRGLPERAVVIALATAMQESRLRNLDYGDRDSLGLFQQRPSQGWGSPEQVQDPVYAAGKFYDHLVQVPHWESLRVTESAQLVQKSAFPEAYEKHSAMAIELTAALAHGDKLCG
jgi:hypothetical protein